MMASTEVAQQAEPIPLRYWWLKRISVTAAVFLVSLIALRWSWGVYAHNKLQAEIDAIIARGEPIFPQDFDPQPIPDEQNAALRLQEAVKALVLTDDQQELVQDFRGVLRDEKDRWDEVRAIIENNSEVLRLVREARSLPDADWGIRVRTPAVSVLLPDLGDQRELSKLLWLVTMCQRRTGHDHAAIETIRDMLAISEHVEVMPNLISHLVALAVSSIAVDAVEQITPDLMAHDTAIILEDADGLAQRRQVQAIAHDLLDEQPVREGLTAACHSERMMSLDSFLFVMRSPLWQVYDLSFYGEKSIAYLVFPMFELDTVHMLNHMNQLLEAVQEPSWPAAVVRLPNEKRLAELSGLRAFARPSSRLLLGSLERSVLTHFRFVAMRRMAAVAIAIRLYELDRRHRPRALQELVPDYLVEIPTDPFAADGRPISYFPEVPQPLLYSIGPNGIDDGGRYSDEPKERVEWEKYDIPFFLNGDRPQPPS